jgi:penicillin-binding protein 1C
MNGLKNSFSPRMKFLLRILGIGITIFLILYILIPVPDPLFPPDYSTVVLDEDGEILRIFLNDDEQWHLPPDDSPIPEKLKTSVIAYEDKYFYRHPGVNPFSLLRALRQNLVSQEIISGASTLTMQVARLMRPKERTLPNKLLEILQAFKIEILYSKDQILSLYLNHAPYGGNIIGYRAASLRYFGKMPHQLTWGEAATLAVLPNAPGLISPTSNPKQLLSKRNRLLRRFRENGRMDGQTYELAILEPIPNCLLPTEFLAPHLSRFLKNRNSTGNGVIRTTIKRELQKTIEDMTHQQIQFLKTKGIYNGAALVVETQTGKVRAYVGSQDFFDQRHRGQVDGVRASRSSGSLLKPFLYALSIQDGIILPATQIRDVPSYYGAFSPNNADQKFRGLVSAKEALVRSLNVPAARLLYTYGVYPFHQFLKNAGLSTLFRNPDDYGLPLILGGAEVTLWDMAMLFRGLADSGAFRPLRVLTDNGEEETNARSTRLIEASASYLTLEILRELKRPGAEYYWEQYQNQWPIAWKTGTSYGQRDAWAVGVNPEWTIAVWVGNFDGRGNASLAGASCAAPLLFDIFNYLPKKSTQDWFVRPEEDLIRFEVCQATGFRSGPHCEKAVQVQAPHDMKPMKTCPYHHSIYVTEDAQVRVCSLCWGNTNYKKISSLTYPPEVVEYMRARGQHIGAIVPHKPDCPAQIERRPLAILYPQENTRIWLPHDFNKRLQKLTMKVAQGNKDRQIFWYVDNRFEGSTTLRHEKALSLARGWHWLEVVDEVGNRDRNRFFVDLKE